MTPNFFLSQASNPTDIELGVGVVAAYGRPHEDEGDFSERQGKRFYDFKRYGSMSCLQPHDLSPIDPKSPSELILVPASLLT